MPQRRDREGGPAASGAAAPPSVTGAPLEIVGPASSYYVSQRLRLHYVDWGNPDAPALILLHGGRDHARSWDQVARTLRDRFHVVAPDLRGHGDSAWAVGSSYSMAGFVYDLVQLVDVVSPAPVTILGHSFGGAIASWYAASLPERVARLVNVEGFGPPPQVVERWSETPVWDQTRAWIEQMRGLAKREPRRYPTIDAAAARMREENPSLSDEQARHLTVHGVARNEDGTFSWKFDNYFRSMPPREWRPETIEQQWTRIECPTLLVRGSQSWASDPREDGRFAALRHGRYAEVDGAGHYVMHDRLVPFLEAVVSFLEVEPD